ncbi:hypothetical protein ACGFZK_03935 [Streptomyces sp. NPDC048257]|uniref:hypothetical protein n=1 Tax=Streptomyces sp. NPDC048257 TaxID=3365526 RepID=UPI00370F9DDB
MNAQDADAVAAFEAAPAGFTEELNLLHIAGGSPTYASLAAAASSRPRLTKAGLNEMLAGKRFTSLDSLLEFVRVVTTSSAADRDLAHTGPDAGTEHTFHTVSHTAAFPLADPVAERDRPLRAQRLVTGRRGRASERSVSSPRNPTSPVVATLTEHGAALP